ncbi:uncharacterized protein MKK02DRAFT_44760 [Dioszegia hungarica]|uniref:intramembrane prenyl-peptidase Rce1 n=1 Tax=Dioszegia hungarica TaxID=4972 RepID=A0AA38LVX1_9TREE|nr:uncharacterized protein MKK02DRAFT_44760 [Dioszegia hungarica]KAI9636059.1 hypothetical protein MKK02DRAFT_44760 [Dioszegia hungarica]
MGPLHPLLAPPPQLALNPLSSTSAHLLSFLFTSGYVGSIYISNHLASSGDAPKRKAAVSASSTGGTEENSTSLPLPPISAEDAPDDAFLDPSAPQPGDRNHPATIRSRMKAVGLATALSLGGVWYTVKTIGGYGAVEAVRPTLSLLGLPLPSFPSLSALPITVLPYVLAPALLLGPLYATYLDGDLPSFSYTRREGLQIQWDRFSGPESGWGLAEWRNYVVGPLTEELVFRSCLLSVALLSRTSMRSMTFATPLWFGVAHAHHAWETYTKGGRTSSAAVRAVAGSLFQLTYTTLFGWFATYSYLRTASVLPALASHAYCNVMGIYLPNVAAQRHPGRKGLIWGMYGLGIAGFVVGLRRL